VIGAGQARVGAIACAVLLLAACSGDEPEAAPTTPPPTTVAPTTAATVPTTSSAPPTTAPPTTVAPTTEPTPTTVPPPTPPPADTGVPGLDSEDAFCAAWSRFGGSWQVVLAASAFGDPDDAARLEVLASTVVGDAYDAMFDVWPDELASERDVVADDFFGAFQRRSADALAALSAAGADADDIELLADVWVDALATRSPSDPVLDVAVPDELGEVVGAAADRFAGQRTPFTQDPSMVITAETPATDSFLGAACPDQGSIFGGDVIG
jgi:hypothetical protein